MRLGEVLGLIHTSPDRWRTIRLEGHEWRHTERSLEAFRAAHGDGTECGSMVRQGQEPEVTDEEWRLWVEKPDRIRTEFVVGRDVVTAVIVGDTWWSWSPSRGGITNAGWANSEHGVGPGEALLDLAPLLPTLSLRSVLKTTFIGRPAVRILAAERPIDDPYVELRIGSHRFSGAADEYELVVDSEHGVGLRIEVGRAGHAFMMTEATLVAFDEDLNDEVFAPPGDGKVDFRIEPPTRAMPIDDAARVVPFEVLVPEHPPVGPVSAIVEFGPPMRLVLRYATPPPTRGDNRSLCVMEAAEPLPKELRANPGEIERTRSPLPGVRLRRGGTHVAVFSADFSMNELTALSRSLVPFLTDARRLIPAD